MTVTDLSRPRFLEDEDVSIFERSVIRFLDDQIDETVIQRWRDQKSVGREIWREAGAAGLLGVSVPEAYGGSGGDFRHEVAIIQAVCRIGAEAFAIAVHNPVVLPYLVEFGTEAQKQKWLPDLCTGDRISAIAMTEPAAGSDLRGMRTTAKKVGDTYVLSGQKTFITNGQLSDFILVAAKTEGGISLFVVEPDKVESGFERGRNLDKIGLEGQDTSELFFDNLVLPAENLLGEQEGQGLRQLMAKLAQERIVIAWQSMAMIERALSETIAYVRSREMFGQTLADFQNTQFKLAEFKTEATIAKVFINHCTELLLEGSLDGDKASMAKYWISDLLGKIVDGCLQFYGGYGFMKEYPIARMYQDSRIHRIYGGANEVMKLLIARNL
ncbi:MAG: acyl-CoA dehydrogenase family protein [Candidatus Brevundimonas colombiensis]|uniref:Acyl-CoA dehydrogenase family protein n=1 Tax=Candidatus Brevundimonas colombiensis TaxID=3121376 RepID=A0AAJ6BI62_9CAUL|nr:acyl-CoA dehydrogenase family protein [Brevundimonas sp.]WEK38465.1 MAG: acyl-CoA dehydrogenase family protein [Brevundimonas sp.]